MVPIDALYFTGAISGIPHVQVIIIKTKPCIGMKKFSAVKLTYFFKSSLSKNTQTTACDSISALYAYY